MNLIVIFIFVNLKVTYHYFRLEDLYNSYNLYNYSYKIKEKLKALVSEMRACMGYLDFLYKKRKPPILSRKNILVMSRQKCQRAMMNEQSLFMYPSMTPIQFTYYPYKVRKSSGW